MDPNTIVTVLSPTMAIVFFLNLLVGAGSVLAAGGSLGPIKLPAAAAGWFVPVVAIFTGTVGFLTTQATSDATKAAFHFTAMLVITALLVGFGNWLAAALAGQAVQHHVSVKMLAKARAANDNAKPTTAVA